MQTVTAKLDRAGRLVIPAEMREALGVSPGSEVLLGLRGDEVVISTRRKAVRTAQDYFRSFRPPDGSLVSEELSADRRGEADAPDCHAVLDHLVAEGLGDGKEVGDPDGIKRLRFMRVAD